MDAVIAAPSQEKSKYAPRIHTLQIPTHKIRDLIGPGGKVIRGIIDATGVKIDVDDTGRVNVASSDADGLAQAIQMISDITAVPEVGKTYLGKVVRLAEFGAFVEIFPGTDGLLHVSEIAEHRVAKVQDELREGDQILVKVLAIEGNRIKLSRKAVLREQRAKLGLDAPAHGESSDGGRAPSRSAPPPPAEFEDDEEGDDSEVLLEGGAEFDDDDADDVDGEGDSNAEPNFNRPDPVPAGAPAGAPAGGGRGPGGPGRGSGGGGRGPGGGAGRGGRRRRSGRGGPGGGGGGRGPGGGGGNR
jgi:polyribonucleotide nucleotidyltransferase